MKNLFDDEIPEKHSLKSFAERRAQPRNAFEGGSNTEFNLPLAELFDKGVRLEILVQILNRSERTPTCGSSDHPSESREGSADFSI
jgi:hypothetical protein